MDRLLLQQAFVQPHWLPSLDTFWYKHPLPNSGFEFILVDIRNRTRQGGFDSVSLAQHIQQLTNQPTSPESLLAAAEHRDDDWDGPLSNDNLQGTLLTEEVPSPFAARQVAVRFVNKTKGVLTLERIEHAGGRDDYGTIRAGKSKRLRSWCGHVWRLADKETGVVKAVYAAPKDDVEDVLVVRDDIFTGGEPKEGRRVFVRDYNVWVAEEDRSHPITSDATRDEPYDEHRVYVSPDRKYAVVWQYVPEQQRTVFLVDSSPEDQLQPKLRAVQCPKPGDRVRVDRPRLFNLAQKREVPTDDLLFRNPYELINIGWSETGPSSEYRFIFNERGHQHLRVLGITSDGAVRLLVEDSSKTFIDYANKFYRRVIHGTGEFLWMSERDGWNHLYLYDLDKGVLKNQITRGKWVVRAVDKVDEQNRRIWFSGYGMSTGDQDSDPYCAQLARINFDGSDLKILTPEGDGINTWKWSPDDRYLIHTWSRVDHPPSVVVRDGETGDQILALVESDPGRLSLLASGWNPPERFAAPGRDGKAMIHGIIIRPSDFDPTSPQKYPVVEYIYAGPNGFSTPNGFDTFDLYREWAELGFVVVVLDGMGTNWRSKAFHDVCYKNLHDAGFPDRIAWIKSAAEARPWMDLSRGVGIWGTSAGGQNAAAALLFHGDFYKVAAADTGCHDNRLDKMWWGELWMGWPVDGTYEAASNVTNVARLRPDGKLLLVGGGMDDIVDPSSTLQFVNALNKAKKDFEFLFIPDGGHACGHSLVGQKKMREFFCRHLLGK